MLGSKKRRALITKEERQLIYNSQFINKYPKIKEILRNNKTLYKNDVKFLKNKDIDTYNKILYAFDEIKEQAIKEWYQYKYKGIYQDNCSLCGRKNTYIYLIKNIKNKKEMNVGSECINKFPNIKGNIDGVNIKEHKKFIMKKQMRINRIVEFNNKYPNIEQTFIKWKSDYDNLELIMPEDIETKFIKLYRNSRNFYEEYINGEMSKSQLDDFNEYIQEFKLIMKKSQIFIQKNKNNKFCCNKLIKDWLIDNNLNGVIKLISLNGGFINANIAKSIYSYEFIKKFLRDIQIEFNKFDIKLQMCDSNDIIFKYKYKNYRTIIFENKLSDFMLKFSFLLFRKDGLDKKYISQNLDIKFTERNLNKVVEIFNIILKTTKYKIILLYDKNEIEITNERVYTIVKANVFINNNKKILFVDEHMRKNMLLNVILKISKWKNTNDKKKYSLDEIEKIMINNR